MEARKKVVIPVLALLVGLAAIGLSFLAYAKRIKIEDVRIDKQGVCTYPSSAAFAVGILAALFILIHQILITVATACFCCGHKFPCNLCGIISFILFLLSWASFAIAFSSLVVTAIANDKGFLMNGYNTSSTGKKEDCLLASQELFFGAAFWCIITMVFTLSCYATLMCARRRKEREIPRHNFGA